MKKNQESKVLKIEEIMEVAEIFLIEERGLIGVKRAVPFDYRDGDEIVSLAALNEKNEIIFNEDVDIDDIIEYMDSKTEQMKVAEELIQLQAKVALDRAMKQQQEKLKNGGESNNTESSSNKFFTKDSGGIEINLQGLKDMSIKEKLIGGILVASLGFNVVQGVKMNQDEKTMEQAAKLITQLNSSTPKEGVNAETTEVK